MAAVQPINSVIIGLYGARLSERSSTPARDAVFAFGRWRGKLREVAHLRFAVPDAHLLGGGDEAGNCIGSVELHHAGIH